MCWASRAATRVPSSSIDVARGGGAPLWVAQARAAHCGRAPFRKGGRTMTVVGSRSRLAVLAAAIAAVTGMAVAQARVPARIDGIWNWRHHEPVPSRVHRAERAEHI